MESFEELVSAAARQPFRGWDFSYLRGRYEEGRPQWDYRQLVVESVVGARSLLDIGTGGGEFLSSLGSLPATTCVTEGYRPNTKVALARLGPLGVGVVRTWCDDNAKKPQRGALPFRSGTFDLVIDRHESYVPAEVLRVLKRRGRFVTQQVGEGNNAELEARFGIQRGVTSLNLATAVGEMEAAGSRVLKRAESKVRSRFLDIGALVYFLQAIPWEVPGFTPTKFEKQLREIHEIIQRDGSFDVTTARFCLIASKG